MATGEIDRRGRDLRCETGLGLGSILLGVYSKFAAAIGEDALGGPQQSGCFGHVAARTLEGLDENLRFVGTHHRLQAP